MLNVKSLYTGSRLCDEDRKVFESINDERFQYLEKVSQIMKKMGTKDNRKRELELTHETADAMSVTISGTISLIKKLLESGFKFVLTGKLQSDRLEGEFGCYRQYCGGNFNISTYQVFGALKIQRLKLFNKLQISEQMSESGISECCGNVIENDEDLNLLDNCFELASTLSEVEKSTLYFIAAYVGHKEKNEILISEDTTTENDNSEFLEMVSRGKLSHPSPMILTYRNICTLFLKINKINAVQTYL